MTWVILVLCFVISWKYSFFWKQCLFWGLFPPLSPLQEALPHTLLKLRDGIGVSRVELGFPGRSGCVSQAVLDVSGDKAVITLPIPLL